MEVVKIPRVLNKEILLLMALSLAAFGVFVFTRHMAAREQQLEAKIAAVWFERGIKYMDAGQTDKAIQAFRKATSAVGNNPEYILALANALSAENHDAEAQQLLLRLRESDPENVKINTHLARLAAKDGDVQEAVRYYQNALYGRWSGDEANQRRQLRIELVRFLLAHQQSDLASSELLTLQARTPESATAHIEVAKLFVEANDKQRALQEYSEAVRLDGNSVEALTGAGEMAFEIEDSRAEQYLKAALALNPDSRRTRQLLTLIQMMQSEDPLLPNLTPTERRSRLLADLDRSMKRLDNCLSQVAGSTASKELESLKFEALALQPKLRSTTRPPDLDAVRSGLGLIFRMQQAASGHCGQPAVEDQALLLIGRQRSKERP